MENVKKYSNIVNSRLKIRAGPAGLHFFNRTTGINVLVDEITPSSSSWASAPRQVSVALTNACDLACSHCYAPKIPAMLAFDKLTSWLTDLDANGCIGVGFGGGEPTLHPDLARLCSFTARETKLAVILTTHAHRLSDSLLKELAGNVHFFRVSMDGIGSTYESIRCRPFGKLLERITALSRIAKFGINYLVNSKTIGDLEAAAQLTFELGASEFLLIPEVPVGQGKGIDNETTNKFREWVYQYHGSIPLAVSEGSADGLPTCDPLGDETGLAAFAHIDASGIIKRTSYDSSGIFIGESAVMAALDKLKETKQKVMQ